MTHATSELRKRLERLANDCEERARRMPVGSDARAAYFEIGKKARAERRLPVSDPQRLKSALLAYAHQLSHQALIDGDLPIDLAILTLPSAVPEEALPTMQLAKLFGISDRWAREAIRIAFNSGSAGFYRLGARWYALPEAFSEFTKATRSRV